jgi:threonine dehydrogenase-like Zn-dependent dehydrogenase
MAAILTTPGGPFTRSGVRAVRLTHARAAQLVQSPLPEPAAGQIRIALQGSGVCASSLPVWEGRPWFAYPLEPGAPGHEGWGIVDAVGADVTGLGIGERVACLSYHAFATHDVAPAEHAVPLADIREDVPFPGEAFACAMNVARAARISPGARVAVLGIGFLGAVIVRLASLAGAQVVAISRRQSALDLARDLGASETVPLDEHSRVVERARGEGGSGVDIAIEATGAQWPLDLSADITREQGRLVIAGYHQDGPRQVNLQLWNWRAFEIVNAHSRDPRAYIQGMQEAVSAVRDGVIDPERFITHVFPLDRLGAAMELLRERPDGFLKAVVVP